MGQNVVSFAAATTLAAQRIVAISAENTVAYPANNQTAPIGVSIDTMKDTTSGIPIQISGKAKILFNDTLAVGGLVSSDSNGRGIPFTLANTTTALTLASYYVGILTGAAVAATATIAEILIQPGSDRE